MAHRPKSSGSSSGYLRVIGRMVATIEETLVGKVAPGARDVAGHLAATSTASTALEHELDAVLRP